jgi:hypothetical protein
LRDARHTRDVTADSLADLTINLAQGLMIHSVSVEEQLVCVSSVHDRSIQLGRSVSVAVLVAAAAVVVVTLVVAAAAVVVTR